MTARRRFFESSGLLQKSIKLTLINLNLICSIMNTKETAHFILSWYVLKLTKYMYVMYVHLNIHYRQVSDVHVSKCTKRNFFSHKTSSWVSKYTRFVSKYTKFVTKCTKSQNTRESLRNYTKITNDFTIFTLDTRVTLDTTSHSEFDTLSLWTQGPLWTQLHKYFTLFYSGQ